MFPRWVRNNLGMRAVVMVLLNLCSLVWLVPLPDLWWANFDSVLNNLVAVSWTHWTCFQKSRVLIRRDLSVGRLRICKACRIIARLLLAFKGATSHRIELNFFMHLNAITCI